MRGVMLFQPVGFNPDYAVHPGEVLRETLDEGHLTQVQIAEACGVSQKHISEVVNGKAGIRASLAIALERALHVDARFWCRLQADWEVHRARLSTDTPEEHGDAD